MNETPVRLTDEDRQLLLAHYPFYRDLASGARTPTTAAQQHFVAVCRGTELSATAHERAFASLKRFLHATGVTEAEMVSSGFTQLIPVSVRQAHEPPQESGLLLTEEDKLPLCWACNGAGKVGREMKCSNCSGTGRLQPPSTETYDQFSSKPSDVLGYIYKDDARGNRRWR